jgi:hypothetical protein
MASLVLTGDTSGQVTIAAPAVAGTTTLTLPATTGTVLNDATVGVCRAWVNFNGTSTVAIRGSFNVTSITDNGTGDYTVNFTTAMLDANYSFVATSGSGGWVTRIASMAAGNCNIQTIVGNTTTATDTTFVNASIFR